MTPKTVGLYTELILNFISAVPASPCQQFQHDYITVAIFFANDQTWNRVKTLLDRKASDFQRRAPVSGSRLFRKIGDFGDRKTAKPNTEIHRNTPKHTDWELLVPCAFAFPRMVLD